MLKYSVIIIARQQFGSYSLVEASTVNEVFDVISHFKESGAHYNNIRIFTSENVLVVDPLTEPDVVNNLRDDYLVVENYRPNRKLALGNTYHAVEAKVIKARLNLGFLKSKYKPQEGELVKRYTSLCVLDFHSLPKISDFINNHGGDLINYIYTSEDFIKYRYLYDCTVEFIEKFGVEGELPQIDLRLSKDKYTESTRVQLGELMQDLGGEVDAELRRDIIRNLKLNIVY